MSFQSHEHKFAGEQAVKDAVAEGTLGDNLYYSSNMQPICAVGHITARIIGDRFSGIWLNHTPGGPSCIGLTRDESGLIQQVSDFEVRTARRENRPINPEPILDAIRAIPVGSAS